jgi:cyanophycin synthetase
MQLLVFRMHLAPSEGLPRNVALPIDMLYLRENHAEFYYCRYRNQWKTTTTRLFSTYCKKIMVLSDSLLDGIYIQNHMMEKGDTTGPLSAEYILKDPTVEFAVLETARRNLRSGLGFSLCDIVITNIQEDFGFK